MKCNLQLSQLGREHIGNVGVEVVVAEVTAGKHTTPSKLAVHTTVPLGKDYVTAHKDCFAAETVNADEPNIYKDSDHACKDGSIAELSCQTVARANFIQNGNKWS